MTYNIPEDIPELIVPEAVGTIGKAVATAGIWVDSYLEKALSNPQVMAELMTSSENKNGADYVTILDPKSEYIMAKIMQEGGYNGGIFGEEGLVVNPTHKKTLVLDGIDGTEAARSRPSGLDSAYGPSAGIFIDDNGLIVPIEGGIYLPRQKKGIVGSTETGIVTEFKVERKGDSYEVSGCKEIPSYNQDRKDVKYIVALFLDAEDQFPAWVGNLYRNANKFGDQNMFHTASSQVDNLAKLVDECGNRSLNLGTSAVIGARLSRLHDIMGLAPAILALGGTIGNYEGAKLGEDLEFIPVEYRNGKDTLAKLKLGHQIPKVPIGPVISAHNEGIYQRVREFMSNK